MASLTKILMTKRANKLRKAGKKRKKKMGAKSSLNATELFGSATAPEK